MAKRRIVPQLPKTAIPIDRIPAADLPGVNKLLAEGKVSLTFIGFGAAQRAFIVPVNPPDNASQTAETGN